MKPKQDIAENINFLVNSYGFAKVFYANSVGYIFG
jgi:hypothetical protein